MNHLVCTKIACALASIALASTLSGCESSSSSAAAEPEPKPPRIEPVSVTTALVTLRAMERRLEVVGTLHGEEQTTVSAKVTGRVSIVAHDLGDVVRPLDVLFTLDDTELTLAVAEAQKAVEMELAKIGLKDLPAGELSVDAIPTVVRAAALEQNASLKLNRAQSLSREIVSEEDFEARQSDHRVAKAAHAVAVLEANSALAAARQKRALLESAEERLRETKVRVPMPSAPSASEPSKSEGNADEVDFVVSERLVSEGEMVMDSPPTPAFRLVRDRTLKLKVSVPERHATQVQKGQRVTVSVESHPGEHFEGTVFRVSPTVDVESRAFQVEALIPNRNRKLKAGSFARASIHTGKDDGALTVPEEAIVTFAGVSRVFIVEDGHARAFEVKTGSRVERGATDREPAVGTSAVGDSALGTTSVGATAAGKPMANGGYWLEISGPLRAGARVVTSGLSKLADGSPVRFREPEAP